ncbi:MAG: hypothetical protein AB7P04_03685 [Bacteriovoracia bacterium]
MKLCEFLTLLLRTQGRVLQELLATCGEGRLAQLLRDNEVTARISVQGLQLVHGPMSYQGHGEGFAMIEQTVTDLALPEEIEFHLWSYPFYRAFIESELGLDSTIRNDKANELSALLDEAIASAHHWGECLVPKDGDAALARKVQAVVSQNYLRFRTDFLRKTGGRALSSL